MSDLDTILQKFQEEFIFKLKYPYKPWIRDNKVEFKIIPDAADVLDKFRDDLRPHANEAALSDVYETIQRTTDSDSALYEFAKYDFDKTKFVQQYESADDGQSVEDIISDAELDVEALAEVVGELVRKKNDFGIRSA